LRSIEKIITLPQEYSCERMALARLLHGHVEIGFGAKDHQNDGVGTNAPDRGWNNAQNAK
tara:strand:- start:133 stop:312 length:180 start_codon:yes stop_codon:yes gene_type:complete